jgi:hypothetical protein
LDRYEELKGIHSNPEKAKKEDEWNKPVKFRSRNETYRESRNTKPNQNEFEAKSTKTICYHG